MRERTLAVIAVVAGAVLVGACDASKKWPGVTGEASALPVVAHPVGPVPGPGNGASEPTNPFADDPQSAQAGRTLFVRFNCSGCHGGRAGGGMGPSLRDEVWIYGGSDAAVFSSIAEGRAHGMPAWGTRLPQPQIWQLVSYIQSLRTDHEPDAPTQVHADQPSSEASK